RAPAPRRRVPGDHRLGAAPQAANRGEGSGARPRLEVEFRSPAADEPPMPAARVTSSPPSIAWALHAKLGRQIDEVFGCDVDRERRSLRLAGAPFLWTAHKGCSHSLLGGRR